MERMSNLMTRWLERNLVRDSNDDNDASASNEAADMEIENNNDDDDDDDDGDDESDEYNNDAGNNDDNDRVEENVIGNIDMASTASSSTEKPQLQGASCDLQNETSESLTSALVQEEPIIKVVQRRKNYQVPSDFGQKSGRSDEVTPDQNIYDEDGNDLSGMRRVGTSNDERDGDPLENIPQSVSFLEDVSKKQQQSDTTSTAGPSRPAIFISPVSSAGR